MRLTWLLALSGMWTLSWLCVRQYGKGLLGSLRQNIRRIYRPAIVVILLTCSGTAYAAQPFVDHSNLDETAMTFAELDDAEGVVCTARSAQVFQMFRQERCLARPATGLQTPLARSRWSPLA